MASPDRLTEGDSPSDEGTSLTFIARRGVGTRGYARQVRTTNEAPASASDHHRQPWDHHWKPGGASGGVPRCYACHPLVRTRYYRGRIALPPPTEYAGSIHELLSQQLVLFVVQGRHVLVVSIESRGEICDGRFKAGGRQIGAEVRRGVDCVEPIQTLLGCFENAGSSSLSCHC
jgi:hypothetical protein